MDHSGARAQGKLNTIGGLQASGRNGREFLHGAGWKRFCPRDGVVGHRVSARIMRIEALVAEAAVERRSDEMLD